MIIQSIKNPTTPTKVWEGIKNFVHPPAIKPMDTPRLVEMPWNKIQFSNWLDKVHETFKVGKYVTLKQIPPTPNCIPLYYELIYIEELHHRVEYDDDLREPRSLMCRMMTKIDGLNQPGQLLNKCPCVMRVLTNEEVELVNLSNKKLDSPTQ